MKKKRKKILEDPLYGDISSLDGDPELESLALEGLDEEETRRAYEAFKGDFVDGM